MAINFSCTILFKKEKVLRMKRIIYLSISIMILMASCATTNTVKYTVASQNADCVDVGPQKCLLVKKGNATDWEFFYSNIEGFNYVPGYEYTLEVKEEKRVNAPMDASSIKYILVKEVSKVARESENLPPAITRQQRQTTYQCTGKVVDIESANIGRGAADGKFSASVVKIQVTSSSIDGVKAGDTIYAELVSAPQTTPENGKEYVFKAKDLHPAHAKGVYLLETDVIDLVK